MFDTTKRLFELRDNRKMNTNQFAIFTGVSQSYLSQIERGERKASLKTIEKVCKACNISLSEFFAGSDNPANIEASVLSKEREGLLERVEKLKTELDEIQKKLE